MLWRTERRNRKLHERWWRITNVRVKPPIPVFGSVGLRAVRRLTPKADKATAPKVIPEVRQRKRLARAIGVFAFLVLVVAVWMGLGARSFACLQQTTPCRPNGFRGHVAALEFARTAPEVKAIVGDVGNSNRDVMRRELNRDFVFIAFYLALYLLLAAALARATIDFSPILVIVAVVAAVCTAGFDVLENVRALRVLAIPLANLDGSAVARILDAAVIKWTFSFVTIALLSLAFQQRSRLHRALRALFLLTAVMGLVGLVSHPLIPLSMLPLLAGLLVLIGSGFFWPLRLIRDS